MDDCNKEGQHIVWSNNLRFKDVTLGRRGKNNGLKVEVGSKENIYPTYQIPWSKEVVKERATP